MHIPLKGFLAHVITQMFLAAGWAVMLSFGIINNNCYGDALILIGIAGLTTSILDVAQVTIGLFVERNTLHLMGFGMTGSAVLIIISAQITSFVLLVIDRNRYGCWAAGLTLSGVAIMGTALTTYILWLILAQLGDEYRVFSRKDS